MTSAADRLAAVVTVAAAVVWCLPRPSRRACTIASVQPHAIPRVQVRGIASVRDFDPSPRLWCLAGRVVAWVHASRPRTVLATSAVAAGLGAVVGGAVAAIVLGAYAGLVTRAVLRGRSVRLARNDRHRRLDRLAALAADLRAGTRMPLAGEHPSVGASRVDELASAAVRLAEHTGAPLADLLERIESDARAFDRALAVAGAQAAGARATALLLAALPLGGLALGYGIGVDPVRILLHTPLGAACAIGAVVLQVVGLAWADRLGAAALPVD